MDVDREKKKFPLNARKKIKINFSIPFMQQRKPCKSQTTKVMDLQISKN
jgi:hypothetical protein